MEKLRDALELVLLFHSGGEWDTHKKHRWLQVAGKTEATTKVLCDYIRRVLGVPENEP